MAYIYVLKCPETEQVRYVGKAKDPHKRYLHHINIRIQQKMQYHLSKWIIKLDKKGLKPLMDVVEDAKDSWREREIYWIDHYRKSGSKLCNMTDGGEGVSGYKWTEEMKKERSERYKGQSWSKGYKWTEEQKRAMSKRMTGNKYGFRPDKKPRSKTKRKSSPVIFTDIESGKDTRYKSIHEAGKVLGIFPSSIWGHLESKKNYKPYKKWIIKYESNS